jgi:nitroreductase
MTFDLAQVDHLLTTTRAVRKRLDLERGVPRQLILDCIRIATQAPAGGNYQKWRWLVVDDPAKRAAIADAYQRAYAPYIDKQRLAVAKRTPDNTTAGRIMSSSDYLTERLGDVPMHVIPCALGSAADDDGNGAGWWGSVLPAVWSFMLAARARGLGTVWTTLHLRHEREVGELLGIPDTVTQLCLIPTAYYTGDDFKPGDRRPAEEVTYWNTWKDSNWKETGQ